MLLASNFGISWATFPRPNSSEPDQLSAQLDVCQTVTSEMDTLANQSLRATYDIEQEFGPDFAVTILPNGWCRFRLSHWPILQLISAQVSPASSVPPNWTTVPQTSLQTEHSGLPAYGTVVPSGAGPGPTAALIAPGYVNWSAGRKGYFIQVNSINGFPTAGIDQTAAVGATSIHVDDITGFWDSFRSQGARATIFDPPWREIVTVTGATPDIPGAYSGPGTLTIDAPLQFRHVPDFGDPNHANQTVLLTTMPQALLQAGYYLATHYALIRGASAAVMQSSRAATQGGGGPSAGDWYERAEKIIGRYARVF